MCWNEEILKTLQHIKRYSEVPEIPDSSCNAVSRNSNWLAEAQEGMSKLNKDSNALVGLIFNAHKKFVGKCFGQKNILFALALNSKYHIVYYDCRE